MLFLVVIVFSSMYKVYDIGVIDLFFVVQFFFVIKGCMIVMCVFIQICLDEEVWEMIDWFVLWFCSCCLGFIEF